MNTHAYSANYKEKEIQKFRKFRAADGVNITLSARIEQFFKIKTL
jgi:hypothetical protein